ncbi:TBC1 domain member 1 [Bulinus truncatus]|nr:TBC1 domain member 1 [Bulinus truncatus]
MVVSMLRDLVVLCTKLYLDDSSVPSTPDLSPMPSPMSKEFQHDFPSPPTSPGPIRKRSATLDSLGSFSRQELQMARRRDVNHNKTNSPLKTTFLLATNTPQHSDSLTSSTVSSPLDDHTLLASNRRPSSSWRKAIFNRVCTPQHSLEFGDSDSQANSDDGKLHNTVEIRAMWKKAILETLLLIRMEKENHDIRARQEEGGGVNVCRKLEYQELTPCLKEITSVWEQMLTLHEGEETNELGETGKPIPLVKLLDYVKKGVPRSLRGQIWLFLMQQRQMSSSVPDSACEATDYDDLLKQLTTHQHAILIDLGELIVEAYSHDYIVEAYSHDYIVEAYSHDYIVEAYSHDYIVEAYSHDYIVEAYSHDYIVEAYSRDYIVEAYSRDYIVEAYSRDYIVEAYSRDYIVEAYSRDYIVEAYSRDYIVEAYSRDYIVEAYSRRTFPCHPYFAKALGPGQLELFNLLKAYSLLDPEVGYCQGLSFIVGMLLMHMEEISAFHVLKYMMYDLGLRKQFRPNMTALQIKLYQLTRLLHDHYKDVYDHFETHEISPTLYAAPWFLTLFASQFPLGFVSRVFDMIFVQGIDCLFKVALMLIGSHRALILQCDSFESVVDFLKTTLPEMVQVQMERIINQAFELDITKELQAYEVEYHVLSEEMTFSPPHDHHHGRHHHHHHHCKPQSPPAGSERATRLVERRRSSIDIEMMYRMEQQNRLLKNQNMELLEKLQHAQSQQRSSEHSVHVHQIETEKLKSHIRTLELERGALLQAVAKLKKVIPRESLLQLNLALPPMPDSSPHQPMAPMKPVMVSAATQVKDKDFSVDFLDLATFLSNSSTFSDSTSTNSNHLSTNCSASSLNGSQTSLLASTVSAPNEATTAEPVSPRSIVNTSPSAGEGGCITVSRTPPRITLPMPHLQLSAASTGVSEHYSTRSISNVSGSVTCSTPLTPEERRKSVKVVVQQSPTSCPDKPTTER